MPKRTNFESRRSSAYHKAAERLELLRFKARSTADTLRDVATAIVASPADLAPLAAGATPVILSGEGYSRHALMATLQLRRDRVAVT